MPHRSLVWSSLRDLFGGWPVRRRRSRGKRPATCFSAQFDGGDGGVGWRVSAPLGGYETLEVRMMFAAPESDFGFDDASGTITSYAGTGGDVEIPTTISGKAVTGIGDSAFFGCSFLTGISLPAGITNIGSSAFSYCSGLTTLSLPAGVTSIGDYAFIGCRGLTTLSIPAGVTSIGDSAFAGCSGLTSLSLPAGITNIGSSAFSYCSGLTNLSLPAGITSIGDSAFIGCRGLTTLSIPAGVTSIGDFAFAGCSGLTSLSLPAGITNIGRYALFGCSGLTSLSLPAGVTSIGDSMFSGCSGLTSLDLPAGVTSIGDSAFSGCTGLTSLTLPAGVTDIGHYAFSGCFGLTSVTLPAGVTSIGDSAFLGCSGLTTLSIPAGVTSVGNSAFSFCNGLTSITLPAGITSISEGMFSGCSGLTSLTLPAGVTSIGDSAFGSCFGLKSLSLPAGVTSIGNFAFFGCTGLTSLLIPAGVTSIGSYAFSGCSGLTNITLPTGVTSIGYSAFSGCTGLTSLTIPAGVTDIGYSAFSGCFALKSLSIPAGVTSIGDSTFADCSGLKSVYFLGNAPAVGFSAFDGVTATIYHPADTIGWTNRFQGLPTVAIAVSLSPVSASIAENNAVGAVVGTFSMNDPNPGAPLIYTLVDGEGSTDNDSFSIVGNRLEAAATFNYEVKNRYTVRVRGVEPRGLATETAIVITVTDVAEAPTVVAPASFTIVEDTPTRLTFSGAPFADADSPAGKAMTVTLKVAGGAIAATSADGVTVAGTAAARTFTGTIANLNAYFTASPERITFTPAADSHAASTLTTTIAESSGSRKLSSSAASTLVITPVNDAPHVFAPKSFKVTEDVKGNLRWPAGSTPFVDVDSPRLTVTLSVVDGAITAAGTAAVTVDGSATARTFTGSPAALNAYFKALGTIAYTTAPDNTVARTLTTTVSDGDRSASAFTTIAIKPVNDAPTIDPAAVLGGARIGIPFEITYETLRTALHVSDAETAAPALIIRAIRSGSLQTWSGTGWVNVAMAAGAAFPQRSLSLSEGDKIRWLPPARVSGDIVAFDVLARDGSLSSTTTAKVSISLAEA